MDALIGTVFGLLGVFTSGRTQYCSPVTRWVLLCLEAAGLVIAVWLRLTFLPQL